MTLTVSAVWQLQVCMVVPRSCLAIVSALCQNTASAPLFSAAPRAAMIPAVVATYLSPFILDIPFTPFFSFFSST